MKFALYGQDFTIKEAPNHMHSTLFTDLIVPFTINLITSYPESKIHEIGMKALLHHLYEGRGSLENPENHPPPEPMGHRAQSSRGDETGGLGDSC